MQFAVKPERLIENMYLMDSFPLSVYYRDGKLWATARTPTMSWTTSTPDFIAGEWQLVEVTWQPQRGNHVLLYVKYSIRYHIITLQRWCFICIY